MVKKYSSFTQQIGPFTCSIMELYIDKTVGGDRYDKKDSSSSQLVMNTRPVQITTAVIQVSPLSNSLF